MESKARNSWILIAFLIGIIGCVSTATAADTISVNTTGWWKDGDVFHPDPANPIQAAIQNATADSVVTIVELADYPCTVNFGGGVQNGITLDLGGATLNGTGIGSPGVTITGKSGTTVKNGHIMKFTHGILASGTNSNLRFENLTITDAIQGGIQITDLATNLVIDHITITNPGIYGIEKSGCGDMNGATITNTTITGVGTNLTQRGITIQDSSCAVIKDIVLDNVTVSNAGTTGIWIDQDNQGGSTNIAIRNSTVTGAGEHGYFILGRNSVVLENNTAQSCGDLNTEWGMYITGAVANTPLTVSGDIRAIGNRNGAYFGNFQGPATFQGDNIRENQGIQFQVASCTDITLKDARITKPAANTFVNGIRTSGTSTNLRFENVSISDSSEPGIQVYNSVTNLMIDHVTITNPGVHGIEKLECGDINGATITNTTITGVGTNLTQRGITIQDSSCAVIKDIVLDNVTVSNAGTTGIWIDQDNQGGSTNIAIRNSTVTGAGEHGYFILGRNSVVLENNTAQSCGDLNTEWGMYITGAVANTPLTVSGDIRAIGNRNGAYFGNFQGPATFQGDNIRENQGVQFQVASCTDITLKDARITKPAANTFVNGIRTSGTSTNLRFENVSISDSSEPGIQVYNSVTNLMIDHVTITNPGVHGIEKLECGDINGATITNTTITGVGTNLTQRGITIQDSSCAVIKDIVLDNVTVSNAGTTGIWIDQDNQGGSTNIAIRNSTVTGAGEHGYFILGRNSVVLENNTAQSCGDLNTEWGMYITGAVANTPLTVSGDIRAIGNRNGAYFGNFQGPATFQGDNIRENQGVQFQVASCTDITLKDARITKPAANTFVNGIRTSGTSTNLRFENVSISDSSEPGIQVYNSVTNLMIDHVTITNPGVHGIEKLECGDINGATITNTTITGVGTNLTQRGITIQDSSCAVIKDIVLDNVTVSNAGTTGIWIDQDNQGGSTNIAIRNSTVTGAGEHGYFILGRNSVVLENNTAQSCGDLNTEWGMYITGAVANTPLTVSGDIRAIGNRNGAYFGNFQGPATFQGDNIRENQGVQFQVASCTDITLKDARITKPAANTFVNGIRTSGTSTNLRFENVSISDSSEPGIQVYNSVTNLMIDHVTITNPGVHGIEKLECGDINGATITNTTITGVGTNLTQRGITLPDGSCAVIKDIVLDNVTVSNVGTTGIWIDQDNQGGSTNIAIRNSTVRSAGHDGFSINGRGTIILENNIAENCGFGGSYGLSLTGISNPTTLYRNNTFQANAQGNYISGIQGNFNESHLQNVADDLNIVSGSLINTYNTTFDKAKSTVGDSSVLNTFWFLDITVKNPADAVVPDASVTVTNASGATILTGTTGPDGTIPRAALMEWTRTATTAVFYTPFLIHAEKTGVGVNDTSLSLNRSMAVTLILGETIPVANFTGTPTSGNAPLDVQFNDTSTASGTPSYQWIFSDAPGTVFTEKNFTHTFGAAGMYDVNHSVTNSAGTSWKNMTQYITVTDAQPVTNFTGTPRTGPAPLLVTFNDTSTGTGITTYQWIFSDSGTVYTTRNLTHSFTNPGSYHVNHSATNTAGTIWKNETGYISVTDAQPVTNFTGTPRTGTAPLLVSFNDTSTGIGITAFQWIFSDSPGTVFTTRNLTHTFANPGSYHVNHSATNSAGTVWKNETGYITVTDVQPVTNFTGSPRTGTAPLLVSFNDTSTGTGITAFQWIFSDSPGTVFTTRNLTHTFANPGSYDVNHSATNSAGTIWKNEANYITVTDAQPVTNFSGTPRTGTAPLPVTFNDTSTGSGITAFQWIFSDIPLQVFTTRNLTHTFTNPGSYHVNHSATNGAGTVWKNVTNYITVTSAQNPVPRIISINPTSATAGGAGFTLTVDGVNFTSTSMVRWNGVNRTTAFVSATRLNATIASGDIATQGTKQVTVFNPAPGGGTSNAITFTINPAAAPPKITGYVPTSGKRGAAAFSFVVSGSGFQNGATVSLTKTGAPTIEATGVTVASNKKSITCTLKIPSNAPTGSRSVVVRNPDGKSATVSGFTVK